ncbi:MAG: Gfo/Idh/MocA family oxidoreductase [Armatimonadota bacterium]|nr:MAG: Gfo/Idh/MocA family oxidoreductase [Armatimonadota bacterium]
MTNFGIIGCGVIGPTHADAIAAAPEATLVAVCDVIEEKAKALAEKHGAEHHTDYRELLARDDIHAVCICTPSGMHADMAVDAARAGKHVMCEKPMDIHLAKMDAMISECAKAEVKLGVIFQRRTQPVWRKVHDTVQSGTLGKMVLGDAYLKYFRSQEYYDSAGWRGTWQWDGGGALMNQGVHCVDLLQWIMGPVTTIFARADHLVRNIEVEDTAVAALTFANGAFGVLEGTTSVVGMNHRLEFHGDQGTICVDGDDLLKWEVPGETLEGVRASLTIERDGAASDPTAITMTGHARQIADLAQAIREDRKPMVTGEDARHAVEIILGVYRSARSGGPVTLPLESE